jgi:pentatricopeptide repeat protein
MLQACARLGRIDEAFELIEKLMGERKSSALQIAFDPLLDPLRPDARWERVLERLGVDSAVRPESS